MKSASNICLLQKGYQKPNFKLTLNKQNLVRKNSMHLTPIIINTTPSKPVNNSNQQKLKNGSVPKRKQLKLNNQGKKILSLQTSAFHIHQITNTHAKKSVNKIDYHIHNRSISKKIHQVNVGDNLISIIMKIDEENTLKQFNTIPNEDLIIENTFISNKSITIQKGIINHQTIKFSLQTGDRKLFCKTEDSLSQKTLNLKELPMSHKKSSQSNLELKEQIIMEKNQMSSLDPKSRKLLTLESNIVEYAITLSSGLVLSSSEVINIKKQRKDQKQQSLDSIKQALSLQIELLEKSKENYFYLQSQIDKKQLHLYQLQQKLNRLRGDKANIESQYEQIVNFSRNQEKNRILKMISNDYLQLQAEIYDYAAYLQSNQLANDLNFEPKPFSEIERLILQRERELKESLLKNGKGISENALMMSDFISETIKKRIFSLNYSIQNVNLTLK